MAAVQYQSKENAGRKFWMGRYTKEKPGFWTRLRAFAQVTCGSNIQLLPFALVAVRVHLHMSFGVRLDVSFQQRRSSAVVMRAPSFGR
jgi:hypothetical protein